MKGNVTFLRDASDFFWREKLQSLLGRAPSCRLLTLGVQKCKPFKGRKISNRSELIGFLVKNRRTDLLYTVRSKKGLCNYIYEVRDVHMAFTSEGKKVWVMSETNFNAKGLKDYSQFFSEPGIYFSRDEISLEYI